MKIRAIKLENVRGFKFLNKTAFSESINVFIGANNSGKSTILNSIHLLQKNTLGHEDITIGETSGMVYLYIGGRYKDFINDKEGNYKSVLYNLRTSMRKYGDEYDTPITNPSPKIINEKEPDNLIYPYLSKRKVGGYRDEINGDAANSVSGNFSNLYSKIDRLVTPQFQPGNRQYIEACNNILGFEVSTIAKGNGKHAVYYVYNSEHIGLTAMGEGVANILGLITDLCIAEDKIFLIEEPENDIHPKALKALMQLIVKKSNTNQFFVSTHSNIVMKYLGSAKDSKVFNITNETRDAKREKMFISTMKEVGDNPEERRQVLEDLGYDFFDFDLWKGWLFLEESSAEIIIRDYLVDWFVKPLKNKVKTFSAGGTSNVILKFEDFNRLFVFLHLEPSYKNKVWVLIDGGNEEKKIIDKMKETYIKSGWNESSFGQFDEHDFERYYPKEFQLQVDEILTIEDRQTRRNRKRELLEEVKNWIGNNEEEAKEKFKESAKEVIDKLKLIAKQMA
ncbi:MAG: AAA family ATPase [Bacteroidota bacterium]